MVKQDRHGVRTAVDLERKYNFKQITAMAKMTPAEILAAIGAIGFKRVLTAKDDLDTLTEPGIYRYSTSSVPANCPFPNAGTVEVLSSDGTSGVIQRVTRYGVAGCKKERIQYGGSWNVWTMAPLMFQKTYTNTTNSNGNMNTSIPFDYVITAVYATDANGEMTYCCNLYRSTSGADRCVNANINLSHFPGK